MRTHRLRRKSGPFFMPAIVHRTVADGETILCLHGKIGKKVANDRLRAVTNKDIIDPVVERLPGFILPPVDFWDYL